MTLERQAQLLCRINAIINWTVSPRGILNPVGMATAFGGGAPNYPFVIRLWSAFIFMFGCMFWETSRNVRAKSALFKYNWIEKSITGLAVTLGYFAGEAPPRLMFLIVLTNWLWIPAIIFYDLAVRRAVRNAAGETRCSG
jgi:hypothetical protein